MPLSSPLIPLPASPRPNDTKLESEQNDPYSPLFTSQGESNIFKTNLPKAAQNTSSHRKTPSTDSEFGLFVSVAPLQDPLSYEPAMIAKPTLPNSAGSYGPFASAPASAAHTDFFTTARLRSRANEQRVLDELLEHEDDPMYWIRSSGAVDGYNDNHDNDKNEAHEAIPQSLHVESSSSSTENKLRDPIPTPLIDIAIDADHDHDHVLVHDFASEPLHLHPAPSSSPSITTSTRRPPHRHQTRRKSSSSSASPPMQILARMPSVPVFGTSPSEDVLMDAMSMSMSMGLGSDSNSTAASNSIPTSYPDSTTMDALSSTSSSTATPTTEYTPSKARKLLDTFRSSGSGLISSYTASSSSLPHSHSLPPTLPHQHPSASPKHGSLSSLFPSAKYAQSYPHPSSTPTPTPPHTILPTPILTHETPFAREPFIPASGAPGFGGSKGWNEKGFEYEDDDENEGDATSFESHSFGHMGAVGAVRGTIKRRKERGITLTGRREGTLGILENGMASMLQPSLPPLARLTRTWTLLYSLDQDGTSLQTLYDRCSGFEGGEMVVVGDSEGGVFGAWIGEAVKGKVGGFYGRGDAFLWKKVIPDSTTTAINKEGVKVFKWTGKNDYVALCEPDFISFGGGDGHYGLYLSSSLVEGSSARCLTFANEVLCTQGQYPSKGGNVEFECVGVEVWGVKMGG